jgi:transglutaminase/protease-like cytokinesis protein 3
VETAYIIYTWIHRNIRHDCSDNLKYIEAPETIFDTGKGGPNGISLLFKTMCNHLEIEAGIISGYIKFMKKIEPGRNWNYLKFNNTYYLIDVANIECDDDEKKSFYHKSDFYFGTKPEMFIHTHFPKEAKWQLLNETNSVSIKQFFSSAYLSYDFDISGFKTISPDSFLINENFINVSLTYDKTVYNNKTTFYYSYIDSFGNEEFMEDLHYLLSERKINVIINSITENMDYITIYAAYDALLRPIVSFKINHKNNHNIQS